MIGTNPDIQKHILSILRLLETELRSRGHDTEGAAIGRIAGKLALETDIDEALSKLYSVAGYDQLALQLMWCAEQVRTVAPEEPSATLINHHVAVLADLLRPPQEAASAREAGPIPAADGSGDLIVALKKFDAAVGKLRLEAYEGEKFRGIPQGGLQAIAREAQALGHAASAEASKDVVRFAAAIVSFVEHITRGGLLLDVRVANLLENANLTLQTALETRSGEDFDSLQQATELLEMPDAVLEPPRREQPNV